MCDSVEQKLFRAVAVYRGCRPSPSSCPRRITIRSDRPLNSMVNEVINSRERETVEMQFVKLWEYYDIAAARAVPIGNVRRARGLQGWYTPPHPIMRRSMTRFSSCPVP